MLLTSASVFLYVLAAFSYILFYNAYLPDQVTVLPIHLQYGYGPHPYGIAALSNMKDYQAYDISVSLVLPRSQSNVDRDNFMAVLQLLDKEGTSAEGTQSSASSALITTTVSISPIPNPKAYLATRRVLFTSRRPVLVPYVDPIVSLARRLLFLPGYVLFPSSSSASTVAMSVSLAERVSFPSKSGKSLPSSLFLELQSGQDLRVQKTEITVTAQLEGLRWFMYKHYLSAFLLGTAAFWGCEVVFMVVAWVFLGRVVFGTTEIEDDMSPEDNGKGTVKDEEDMSDTERTFPSVGRQPPLKFERQVKTESGEIVELAHVPMPGAEADDEDEELGWRERDSGIGTSYSDAAGQKGGVRRRTSGRGR